MSEVREEIAQPTATFEQNLAPVEATQTVAAARQATAVPAADSVTAVETPPGTPIVPTIPSVADLPVGEIESSEDNHPRLLLSAADIPALRAKVNTSQRELWQLIRDYADSELDSVPNTTLFSRDDVETYRNFGNQLIAFAFVCVMSEEAAPCNLAKTYLLTFAAWDRWGEDDTRSLGHAHMLLGNALAYDWLYNQLTPDERQMVRESLAAWTQKMYEASAAPDMVEPWNNWWRKAYVQNHYATANSAVGLAGLALLGEDERAEVWIDHSIERMSRLQYLLDGIEDGTWHEGMGYQGYMLTMSLPFLISLRQTMEIDILPHTYLQNYAYWRIYNHLPDTTQFILPFGDVNWNFLGSKTQNVLRFIAAEYDDGHAEWMAQQLVAAGARRLDARSSAWDVLEFIYYDPAVSPQPPTDLETFRIFADLEGVIWRTGWDTDDLVFGLKTGPYGGRFVFDTFTRQVYPWEGPCPETRCQLSMGHDHADANSFYLYQDQTWLAPEVVDLGRHETGFHNTLLIDGQGQYWPRGAARRNPLHFTSGDGFLEAAANTLSFDYVAADATGPYHVEGLRDFTRHVLFVRPNYFLMLDNLDADSAHHYEWVSHFGVDVAVEGDWVRGNAADGRVLGIGVAAPRPFQAATGNDGRPYVRIRPDDAVADVRFIHLLYPTVQADWHARPDVVMLDDTGQAAAARVVWSGAEERVDDVLVAYGQDGSAASVGPYRFDGRVGVVSRAGNGRLQKLFLYGGAFLQDDERDQSLVTNLDEAHPFEAIYTGSSVAISGVIQTEITLFAPGIETVTVNGRPRSFSRSDQYITIMAP